MTPTTREARTAQHLRDFVTGLLAEAAAAHQVRDDIAPTELADFCLHALAAATVLPSNAVVDRLVTVTLAGLHPPR